jgi:hypothetical protein
MNLGAPTANHGFPRFFRLAVSLIFEAGQNPFGNLRARFVDYCGTRAI